MLINLGLRRIIIFISFIIVSVGPEAKLYKINTQHSFVNFEVDYMKISVVKGAFEDFKGTFDYDPKSGRVENIKFEVMVKSINTRDPKRDNHLHQKDFFYSAKYPHITFVSKEIRYSQGKPDKVIGTLTMRGVSQPHTFSLEWKGLHKDPIDKNRKTLFLRAQGQVNRKDFGISWNKVMDEGGYLVGDKVKLDIIIEANPTDARAAFSRFYLNPKKTKMNIKFDPIERGEVKKEEKGKKKALPPPRPQHKRGLFDMLIGFSLFLLLGGGGFFLKKYLIEVFEKRMSERKAELLSDAVLYSLLFGGAVAAAPYMGYSKYL